MKNLFICILSVSSILSFTITLAAAGDLEDHVLKAEQIWKHAAYRDYSAQEQTQISQSFDHLQKAAHDCDRKLVTAQAKHDHAAELGHECKKEWDAAQGKLASVVTAGFGAMPPEINSAQMHTGPGSGTMQEAAAAWNSLSADLSSRAATYESVIAQIATGEWTGPQ